MLPRRLQHVQRADGVDGEVGVRLAGGPVVRRLRGAMDDELQGGAAGERALHAVAVADVEVERREALDAVGKSLGVGARRRLGTEEVCPHVIVEPDDVVALLGEVRRRLGADQAPGTRDDRFRHILQLRFVQKCSVDGWLETMAGCAWGRSTPLGRTLLAGVCFRLTPDR